MNQKLIVFLISICLCFVTTTNCSAVAPKVTVKLQNCIDGDTATFRTIGKVRFLYVDTPESTKTIEPYGKEAAAFTCNALKNASHIQLEYDGNKKDKYNRTLAWIWVDGTLLQQRLVEKGYVEKFYDYGTYRYEDKLRNLQATAKKNRVGLWSGQASSSASGGSSSKITFKNCTELRKVYPNGVPSTHPAYQKKFDRDGDNFACER